MTTPIMPPVAKKAPITSTWHGVTLVDDYAWLKAENWQEAVRDPAVLPAEIRAHLEAENAYVAHVMADTETLQAELFAEMKGRIKEDDSSVPSPDGPWAYFASYVTGGQYPRICRRPRDGGGETILLDGNQEAEGRAYWSLGGDDHSPDHRMLAYATDTNGSEYFTIRIRDLATGRDLADEIPQSDGHMVWSRDSSALYYMRLDDNHRPRQLYRHVLGTPVADDVLVYEEPTLGHYVHVGETQSRDFLLIDVTDHENSEVHLLDASSADPKPRLVVPRREKHLYSVEHHGDLLYILTNSGDAEDFRIVTAPVATPDEAHWKELVPHRPGTLILGLTMYKEFMVRLERENSLPRIVVRDLASGEEHTIAFDEEAYALSLGGGYEFDTTTLRFSYSSMTTPSQVYDYDMRTRTRILRKTQEVPSGHDPADYVTRRLFAPAPDGELVPISLMHHKSTPIDGSAPLYLYGYGSYGYSIPASFSTSRLSLVDRGFVFAIAHIRGGKDKGFRWYTDGKLAKKMNTFTDFIACGEHLVREGYTTRGNIVANGGSAGGLLMGAVANLAPDLFGGIIADVPFVDALNTMLDINLPLTPREFPEWGNPIDNEADFHVIHAYSPYENVEAKAYPHILALAGISDPRVTYWEPAKWIARLRERATSDNMILLRTNMDAGHGGASGRFEALKEVAIDYAFALKVAAKDGA